MNGMKYVGPLILATRDLRGLADFCIEAGVMFYYWGITGAQYVAIRAEQLVGLDQTKLPAVFRDLVWRDSPYETFSPETVAPRSAGEELVEVCRELGIGTSAMDTEVMEAEEFVSGEV